MNPFGERFGSITDLDGQVIEATLERLSKFKTLKWLEIGMFDGATGRGVKRFCDERGIELEWWGIDAGFMVAPQIPFAGAHVVHGRSEEVHPLIPDAFDAIFIDGCHCRNHVMLDTLNYAPKVRRGGFLLFHDTGPTAQGKDKQPCGPDSPEFYISTLAAFKLMDWPHKRWKLVMENNDDSLPLGGMRCYRKSL